MEAKPSPMVPRANAPISEKTREEFSNLKGSLDALASWNLSPNEELEIRITKKAGRAQAEAFAECNRIF
ncbi:hypothetical protein COV61_01980 [Candidatus Micrarchaeota archaeon CG11_big_fil_rev_8_21_14_0_20_47_5]|nr:MAG: hypothetical protein COV61_01980 [Candidatus Micrarchaeota archaeon CG11_big_fil_rev_8_21_14_0_20_47_5]